MQIVIDIDNELYEWIEKRDGALETEYVCDELMKAVDNGTPLPKGHGRLKDIDWIDDNCPDYRTEDGAWCYKWEDIDNAPTIIEADRSEVDG